MAIPVAVSVLAVPGTITDQRNPVATVPPTESPSLVAARDVSPQMLTMFQGAAKRWGVPWQVLAGLAWEQTRNGVSAPGETFERSSELAGAGARPSPLLVDRLAQTPTSPASPVVSSTFPELIPPITQPGYGIWLLTAPGALSDDPQNVPRTVDDMAARMAADASSGRGGLPGSALLGRHAVLGPAVQAGWARIINQLPIVRSGAASATAATSQAAAYSAPTPVAGTAASCPGGTEAAGVTILGPPQASEAQLIDWYTRQGWYPATVNGAPASTLIDDYYSVGSSEGVRPDWAFVQAVLETGWFRSLDTALNNFAGIGHPDRAPAGLDFGTVLSGVTAQIQLLKRAVLGNQAALALPAAPGLPGWGGRAATTWADLTANWASSPDYGRSLAGLHDDLTGSCPNPSSSPPGPRPSPPPATTPSAISTPPSSDAAVPPPAHPLAVLPSSTTTSAPPAPAPSPGPGSVPPAAAPTTEPVKPSLVGTVVSIADAQVGKPWHAGGQGPAGWDIPDLVAAAYRSAGVTVPVDAAGLAATGTAVPNISQVQPGDLLFGAGTAGAQLLGIYQADGKAIAAPDQTTIQLAPLAMWAGAGLTLRRVLPARS